MTRRLLPFLLPAALLLAHLGLIVRAAMHHTGGTFAYPIDDAYIHLALARHIAFDGLYGVTAHAFSASSSSIIWPWLLAGAMKVAGNHVTLPFFLNVAAAIALLAVVTRGLEREAPGLGVGSRTLVTLIVVLLMPLVTLTMVGMEHVLHAALTLAFVLEAARVVGGEERKTWPLLALAAALLGTRYEGAFPVGIAVLMLAARRRFGLAAALAAAGAAPVVLFGLYSMAHGSLFLPNSIALKRQHLKLEEIGDLGDILGGNVLHTISLQGYLLPLVVMPLLLLVSEVRRTGLWSKESTRLLLALGTTIAHVELASLGWFYRYEAYFIVLDVTVVAITLGARVSQFSFRAAFRAAPLVFVASVLTGITATAPLWVRALGALGATPVACRNIFEQQVQTSRFFARYFAHDAVALNDIGAVAYYGNEHLIDLVGLADLPIAKAKGLELEKPLTSAQIASFTREAPVAIIYDDWFPSLPKSWVRLGRLRIDVNKVCASNTVSVYATSGEAVPRVLAALRDFGPELPESVRREGRWIETPPPSGEETWRADTGDVLYAEMKGAPELSMISCVGDDGSIFLPKIGEVRLRGLTLAEANAAAKAKARAAPGPEPTLRLVDERRCRIITAGQLVRTFDFPMDCGTTAAKALTIAGMRATSPVDAYVWREQDGALQRVELSNDPASEAAASAFALRGGDIIIVP